MATYDYTDEGNHQMWNPAHQGGSYSRVSRVQRMFTGSDNVYAALGGDTFRQDSHVAYNQAFPLGTQLQSLTDLVEPERVSTIGIIEDEVAGVGRYFFMKYETNGSEMVPVAVEVYESDYTDELASVAVTRVWEPLVALWNFIEQSMRVVTLGGAGQTFLFYLAPLPGRTTRLHVVQLPDPGEAVSASPPLTVLDLDFEVLDRMYVVPHESGQVFIYLGDTDRSDSHRTVMVGYEPLTSTVTKQPSIVVNNQVPFPQSYAACTGRKVFEELPIHMVLEPSKSWLQGAGASIDDSPNAQETQPPSYRRSTGNAWTMVGLGPDGAFVEDSVLFEGSDIRPWMGTAHSDSQGGQMRVSAVPKMLARIAPPPELYEANGSIPGFDSSDAYALQAQVVVRQEGVLEGDAFVYRFDRESETQPAFGNNRATSNVYDESPPVAPQGAFKRRTKTSLLVPGTVLIESQRSAAPLGAPDLRTVATLANKLRAWDLDDDSTIHGFPEPVFDGDLTGIGSTDHDQSTDCVHGVQGDIFDPDMTIIVGWFVNGFLPPVPE